MNKKNRMNTMEETTTAAAIIRELMSRYDEKRAAWVELNGHANGFDYWFTAQVHKRTGGIFTPAERTNERHGGAYDRGGADAAYGRPFAPHYFEAATNSSARIEADQMSASELADYAAGFNKETGLPAPSWSERFRKWGPAIDKKTFTD